MTDILQLMESPLVRSGRSGNFVQLILAEAATRGMPANIIALLADLSSMPGFTDVMPEPAAKHLAGPLVTWRTHPDQPTYEQVDEVLRLAIKQRSLIAFGGGRPGQMVGTAEIVVAMGNVLKGHPPQGDFHVGEPRRAANSVRRHRRADPHREEGLEAGPGRRRAQTQR